MTGSEHLQNVKFVESFVPTKSGARMDKLAKHNKVMAHRLLWGLGERMLAHLVRLITIATVAGMV